MKKTNQDWISRTLNTKTNPKYNGLLDWLEDISVDANVLLFVVNAILIGTSIFAHFYGRV
tara:strand:- start:2606 stop:2785 length:180 start_codon:yes stop_codon:yes gene_type:complete